MRWPSSRRDRRAPPLRDVPMDGFIAGLEAFGLAPEYSGRSPTCSPRSRRPQQRAGRRHRAGARSAGDGLRGLRPSGRGGPSRRRDRQRAAPEPRYCAPKLPTGLKPAEQGERIAHARRAVGLADERGELAARPGRCAPGSPPVEASPTLPQSRRRRVDAGRHDDGVQVGEERTHRVVERERVPLGAAGRADQHRHAGQRVGLEHVDERLEQAAVAGA